MRKCSYIPLGERLTTIYIILMLLVFPLFTGFRGYVGITDAKLVFFLSATGLWLLGLLVSAFTGGRREGRRLPAAGWFLLAYVLVCCASALASPFGLGSVLLGAGRFDGLLGILLSMGIFLGVSRFGRPSRIYAYALELSMALCCLAALLQLLGLDPLGLYPSDYIYYDMGNRYSGEFLGTIGNANLFSAFLCLCLGLLTSLFVRGKISGVHLLPALVLGSFCLLECTVSAGKLALLACLLIGAPLTAADGRSLGRLLAALGAFCLALGLSLAFSGELDGRQAALRLDISGRALAFLASALALWLSAIFARRLTLGKKTLRLWLAGLSLVLTAAGLLAVYNTSASSGTVYELSRAMRGELEGSFGSSRILIWRDCLALTAERPFLGGGPGTLALRLDIAFSRFVPETGLTLHTSVENAHNIYLGILTDCGLLALLPYLAAMGLTFFKSIRQPEKNGWGAALALGLLAYWVQDFFGLGLFLVSPVMWIIWGLACPWVKPSSQRRPRRSP